MKRIVGIWLPIVIGLILVLSACGEKSQEDVTGDLEGNLEDMSGYKAEAEMEINTGQENQTFNINVWHEAEEYYRVALTNNQDEEGSQIILKNDEGVFVLTPALNKHFEFQSEWPENSSQPYLYQSLVADIIADDEAEFETTDSNYIFRTKTNYQSNNNLPFQEIHLDKNTYNPVLVKVLDQDQNALVQVEFSEFEVDPSFEEDDFTIDKNMASGAVVDTPVSNDEMDDSLTVLYPTFMAGAELTEKVDVELENGKRSILTFTGEKNFTLVEETTNVAQTLSSPREVKGDIVNLGHTVAALSDNRLEWSHDGVDFTLASDELTREELIEVAQSVESEEVK
ncbi:outer membrane lipoprotein-sorting protein [Virgibacillus natechei]|uniref:Outer membrane lipoprotein-sorting protein n=1 Tax=Virgibacillus natechei TaxID=1216297 RepID=A0ABS4IKL7_9BACI|nr:outer membrane lipoprotein carrier protein LolA [Virgibacillus natechei]MBP1971459.1 outer membrane lipoprotein-sorting protein [Virgibacillus natechei]UZD13827.1 outer membrane lipoprotein carrier protein LolA [Virgibacillus natechei]